MIFVLLNEHLQSNHESEAKAFKREDTSQKKFATCFQLSKYKLPQSLLAVD